MSYKIRHAIVEDIPAISEELSQFSEAYSTRLPPYKDKETSEKILTNMVEKHLFLVAEINDEIIGFIAGFACDHIYNPDIRVLAEAFWWTRPEHRRSGVGIQLLEEYEAWGKENVDWILLTIEEDTPIDEKLFLNRGFKRKETSFIMEIN